MNTVLRHRSTILSAAALAAAMTLILQPVESRASVTFNFNYIDAPGAGFNAAGQVGADRRAGLAQAGTIFPALLATPIQPISSWR